MCLTRPGRLLYIHGFRSSARSFKAQVLARMMRAAGRSADCIIPDLPAAPDAAMAMLQALRLGPGDAVIGSSLGGFYANIIAAAAGCRAVLLNPAVRPAALLQDYVGQGEDVAGQPFHFRPADVAALQRLQAHPPMPGARCLLVAAQGDEVLDWQDMVQFHAGAWQWVLPGGDHGLSDFEGAMARTVCRFLDADADAAGAPLPAWHHGLSAGLALRPPSGP